MQNTYADGWYINYVLGYMVAEVLSQDFSW